MVAAKRYYINYKLACYLEGIVYVITCQSCELQHLENTVTQFKFRLRFNNQKITCSICERKTEYLQ